MLFTIENLLNPTDLELAARLIRQSRFIDGAVTAPGEAQKGAKRNLEMEISESYATLTELLGRAIESSDRICMRLLPRFRSNPIINRYNAGMFYREHVDEPIQGGTTQVGRSFGRFGQNFLRADFSMTLFLSDPSTYDGGELQLRIAEESRLVKLPAGSAVCYATGIQHCVRPITRGYRIAAIYWFQSLIRNPQLLSELWNQYCLQVELGQAGQLELAERAASVRLNMIRNLAEL